jgi:hypothetical protein
VAFVALLTILLNLVLDSSIYIRVEVFPVTLILLLLVTTTLGDCTGVVVVVLSAPLEM